MNPAGMKFYNNIIDNLLLKGEFLYINNIHNTFLNLGFTIIEDYYKVILVG